MRRTGRLGTFMIVGGLLVLAYAAAVYFWRDPITDVYERYQQHRLASELHETFQDYRSKNATVDGGIGLAARQAAVATRARRFLRSVEQGEPIGRIEVPEMGLAAVFVHGTRWAADLTRGPGHYEQTSLPGLGRTTAIAGHRTTFGAPFRKIDRLRPGDVIVLELPYGTFRYRVFAHEIVQADDWSVIRRRGFDTIVLSACHPLSSSSRRWIVYARLAEVRPVDGEPYVLAATG